MSEVVGATSGGGRARHRRWVHTRVAVGGRQAKMVAGMERSQLGAMDGGGRRLIGTVEGRRGWRRGASTAWVVRSGGEAIVVGGWRRRRCD